METINDIRREQRSGTAGTPVTGPIPIQRQFGSPSVLKFVALGVCLVGVVLAVIGIIAFIIPLTIGGVMVLLLGAGVYWLRGIRQVAQINPTPEPTVR